MECVQTFADNILQQSMVERGFRINTDVVTPNLKNETLVSCRTVYDAINAMDIDLSSFVVPKELLANWRYKTYAYKFFKKYSYSVLQRNLSSVINCFGLLGEGSSILM